MFWLLLFSGFDTISPGVTTPSFNMYYMSILRRRRR
jgi:hypothetical protein